MTGARQKALALAHNAAAIARAGDLAGGEAAAELAVACDDTCADAWMTLGAICARGKEYKLAARCYAEALKLRPTDVRAWADLGEIFVLLLDYARAAEALRRAITLDPSAEDPSGKRARAVVARTLQLLKAK